jgi:hypothetical protein
MEERKQMPGNGRKQRRMKRNKDKVELEEINKCFIGLHSRILSR